MDELRSKIDAKQAVIGLVGLILSLGLFFYSAMYMNAEGIYSTLSGLALLCGMFSVGYASTGNIVTSSVAPLIMLITFKLVGIGPNLPDSSPFKSFLQTLGANGKFVFLFSIGVAIFTHRYLSGDKDRGVSV